MTDHEKLIESVRDWPTITRMSHVAQLEKLVELRDALMAGEEAHTPTDDEGTSEQQEEQRDGGRGADHEEQQTDDRAATGGLGVGGGHASSMPQATSDGKREVPEPSVEEWAERAQVAREKAIAKGYTPEHDAEHGIRHLLNWAIDYARQGRAEEASGLMLSAIALIDAANPGWSTDERRNADEEAKRRFLKWPAGTGAINGFILGAEWWKLTHPVTPAPQGEPSDAQVLGRIEQFAQSEGVMFADGPRGAWLPVDALLDILGERAR